MTPRKLIQNYWLVLEGLLWSWGLAGAHHRDGGTSLERSPLAKTLLEIIINLIIETTN